MRNMIKIGMILAVLLSMVGFASASNPIVTDDMTADIPTNIANQYPVTFEPATADVSTIVFAIYEQDPITLLWNIPTDEVEGNIDNGAWANQYTTGVTTSNVVGGTATWTFYIRDQDDTTNENDDTQVDKQYKVIFYCDSIPTATYLTGTADSIVTGVPEFPTIALPIAAILGLAFIFQRRKEEE